RAETAFERTIGADRLDVFLEARELEAAIARDELERFRQPDVTQRARAYGLVEALVVESHTDFLLERQAPERGILEAVHFDRAHAVRDRGNERRERVH